MCLAPRYCLIIIVFTCICQSMHATNMTMKKAPIIKTTHVSRDVVDIEETEHLLDAVSENEDDNYHLHNNDDESEIEEYESEGECIESEDSDTETESDDGSYESSFIDDDDASSILTSDTEWVPSDDDESCDESDNLTESDTGNSDNE